jgi:hypothetical protein
MGLFPDADQPDYKVFGSISIYRITAERLLVVGSCLLAEVLEGPLPGNPLAITAFFAGGRITGSEISP